MREAQELQQYRTNILQQSNVPLRLNDAQLGVVLDLVEDAVSSLEEVAHNKGIAFLWMKRMEGRDVRHDRPLSEVNQGHATLPLAARPASVGASSSAVRPPFLPAGIAPPRPFTPAGARLREPGLIRVRRLVDPPIREVDQTEDEFAECLDHFEHAVAIGKSMLATRKMATSTMENEQLGGIQRCGSILPDAVALDVRRVVSYCLDEAVERILRGETQTLRDSAARRKRIRTEAANYQAGEKELPQSREWRRDPQREQQVEDDATFAQQQQVQELEGQGQQALIGADLRFFPLEGLSLERKDLSYADFSGREIANKRFIASDISHTRFRGATITRCDFTGATVNPGTDFAGASFDRPSLMTLQNVRHPRFSVRAPHLDLRGVNLSGKDMEDIDFRFCDLAGSNFSHTNLQRSNLSGQHLSNADLTGADVRHAIFNTMAFATLLVCSARAGLQTSHIRVREASLRRFDLSGLDLSHADFTDSDCRGIDFSRPTSIRGMVLDGVMLDRRALESILPAARRGEVSLRGVNLRHVHLAGLDFSGLDLSGVDFSHADMRGCQFTGATMRDTNISHAMMIATHLSPAQYQGVIAEGTIWGLRSAHVAESRVGNRPASISFS